MAAALLGLLALSLTARHLPVLAGVGRWLGRRTLQIYVLHFPLVACLSLAAGRLAPPALAQRALFAWLYPPAMTAVAAGLSLLLLWLLLRLGLGLLFAPPDWERLRARLRGRRASTVEG